MSTRPLVSVVIPCFNAEQFVAQAITSALDQTYSAVEVIVVDDGSTDGTLDVLRSFGPSIRLVTTSNRGAPAARNCGVALAKGDFVQFLDADDLLYPTKFARQIPVLLDGGVEAVWCDVDVVPFDESGGGISSVLWKPARHDDAVIVALGCNPGTPAPLHTKRLIEHIGGFREELRCAQDRDLHVREACAGATFGSVPAALVKMRRRTSSLSADFRNVLVEYERVIPPAFHGLVASRQMTDARATAFAGFMAKAARDCIRLGEHASAVRYLEAARNMHKSRGIPTAYGQPLASVCRILGPWHAERASRCASALRRMARVEWEAVIDRYPKGESRG